MKRRWRPFINNMLQVANDHAEKAFLCRSPAANAAVTRLLNEIRDDRIREIGRRIAEGSYVIDPVGIAEKMLTTAWNETRLPLGS